MRTAVVLFNLGGPDSLDAVRPFLHNLFSDPLIIRAPGPVRKMLAKFISARRTKKAQAIYAQMGGKSPIVEQTLAQAKALESKLQDAKVFICMRYWHPMAKEVVEQVKTYAPQRIILLPLYPQYSTTTTSSSFLDWQKHAYAAGLAIPTLAIGSYPLHPEFIAAHVELLKVALPPQNARVLFSAHGLPQKIVDEGDPYLRQVEETVQAVMQQFPEANFEYRITYQSRVGPMEWLKPDTEHEILRAAKENKHIIVVPIAFVSEHSETLVELDIEYAKLARENGAAGYTRVPALATHPKFINALADLVQKALV